MKKFISLVFVFAALLLQGCASSPHGIDNSFGAVGSNFVRKSASFDLCPWDTTKSRISAESRAEISKNSESQYRGNEVNSFQSFRSKKDVECSDPNVKPPVNAPTKKK